MYNLSLLLEDSAREVPTRDAIIFGEDTKLSYGELNAAANQVAHGLVELGIEPGDKVALSCPNLPYFPIAYYGILKAGATVVPLNVLLKDREIAYHLKNSDAKAHLCFEGTSELPMAKMGKAGFDTVDSCENFVVITANPSAGCPILGAQTLGQLMNGKSPVFETVARSPIDTAVILYTSGTTGQPKGAELTHSNMLLNARLSDTMYPRHPHDVHLITLPLFHSFGQSVQMNAGFYNQATLSLVPRFDPDLVLQTMERDNVTFFAGVPTMYWALLNHPAADNYDLKKIAGNLRIAAAGGAASPVEVLTAFREKFGVQIIEGYGLSETSPVASFNRLDREIKPGSIGLPVWGVDIRVIDDAGKPLATGEQGEIVIRGHNVMKGYYKKPEETAAAIKDGWLHTGDVGRFDDDGYLYITDRVKDMIIRGGYNVYPRELEETLMTHPGVSLAAVIGIPHDKHGEEVMACIIAKDGATLESDSLIAWCKENMADYKYPRRIELRDSLPMTATGKILKRELRNQYC